MRASLYRLYLLSIITLLSGSCDSKPKTESLFVDYDGPKTNNVIIYDQYGEPIDLAKKKVKIPIAAKFDISELAVELETTFSKKTKVKGKIKLTKALKFLGVASIYFTTKDAIEAAREVKKNNAPFRKNLLDFQKMSTVEQIYDLYSNNKYYVELNHYTSFSSQTVRDVKEHVKKHYVMDTSKIYILRMEKGIDARYPNEVFRKLIQSCYLREIMSSRKKSTRSFGDAFNNNSINKNYELSKVEEPSHFEWRKYSYFQDEKVSYDMEEMVVYFMGDKGRDYFYKYREQLLDFSSPGYKPMEIIPNGEILDEIRH